jgi:hypothetical protein
LFYFEAASQSLEKNPDKRGKTPTRNMAIWRCSIFFYFTGYKNKINVAQHKNSIWRPIQDGNQNVFIV